MEHPCRKQVAVIGAGAAGMMAAICAAESGAQVVLIEKNSRPGRKIGITGKGRCNVTNADDLTDLFKNIVTNPRFLYSALYGFTNQDLMERFERAGVPLKIERGNRVFPQSDSARDIIDGLTSMVKEQKVKLYTGVTVKSIEKNGDTWKILTNQQEFEADAVIIATGGRSYSKTGSSGDGYAWAKEMGHGIQPTRPGLIPLTSSTEWVPTLQGISLKNVSIGITEGSGKSVHEGFGEMLFTHFGVSGPLILSASSLLQRYLVQKKKGWAEAQLTLHIDLKPALSLQQLDQRLLRDFTEYRGRTMEHAMKDLLPERMIGVILAESGVAPQSRAGDLTKAQRQKIATVLKDLQCSITGTRSMEEAIITMGGVDTKQLDPKTMESKLHRGLYFAGEIIDVDALTGGYNLQIAFSTGAAAGRAAAQWEAE